MPFNFYFFKIASRCNLNCSYCYMYNLADQTWRSQPKFMSQETVSAAARRIVEHCQTHHLNRIHISLHGGEPMLIGIPRMQQLVNDLYTTFEANSIQCDLSIQTNGTLISDEWAIFFKQNHISVGSSLDGSRHIHDQYRVDHAGNGSYDQVVRGIEVLRQHDQTPGVLFMVNLDCNPIDVLDEFASLSIRHIDFNLPDCNYHTMPSGKRSFEDTPYGDWLIRLFDYWYSNDTLEITVRSFKNMLVNIMHHSQRLASFAGNVIPAVVETNGDMEPLDALKSVADGFTKTGLNVRTNTFDDLEMIPLIAQSMAKLPDSCNACRYLHACGGGHPQHRYDSTGSINNPSVYCKDLYKLYQHIEVQLRETITSTMLK